MMDSNEVYYHFDSLDPWLLSLTNTAYVNTATGKRRK